MIKMLKTILTNTKKYLKIFAAVLIVFAGSLATVFYLTHEISFSSVLIGLAGFIVLSPAMYAYIKWFDNMFGK